MIMVIDLLSLIHEYDNIYLMVLMIIWMVVRSNQVEQIYWHSCGTDYYLIHKRETAKNATFLKVMSIVVQYCTSNSLIKVSFSTQLFSHISRGNIHICFPCQISRFAKQKNSLHDYSYDLSTIYRCDTECSMNKMLDLKICDMHVQVNIICCIDSTIDLKKQVSLTVNSTNL